MGRSKPPIHSSAPPRVKSKEHITGNSSLKMNIFIKNAKQNRSDAVKINTMQMDPPGGRRRMGRATKVHTAESECSMSPTDADSCNDGGNLNVGASASVVNAGSSECRRSSRKKTIKFDVRDLLNKNRKSHKIQIEARIDSNAPKTGAGPATKEELDSKQKTFIEKSAIFRRYSLSENKPPPRPPPPVALIKTIQQCVGELEQLPLDRDIDLAVISPIARRLSRTQEILTASMMKPKQVSSLIVTKLENATTSTPIATRKGSRQKVTSVQNSPPHTLSKRRGRPKKNQTTTGLSESTADSSNDSSDISEIAIITSPIIGRESLDGEAKLDNDSEPLQPQISVSPASSTKVIDSREKTARESPNGTEKLDKDNELFRREISVSPASSTKAIDLREKTDPSAVTMSPSELMFVGAEEEVFTQDLSSDESTSYLQSPVQEKGNDEISIFGRSDSTETNSSDDSEQRRKKIRVSVKRVNLPSALREHVDLMLKGTKPTPEVIEVLSSNDDDSLQDSKEANKSSKSGRDSSEIIQTRGSSKRLIGKSVLVLDGENSNSTTLGSIVEISSDSAATPVKELLGIRTETASPQLRSTLTRKVRNCRRQANVEEETVQRIPIGSTDGTDHKYIQEHVCNQSNLLPDVESDASTILTKSSPQQTKKSVQKQLQEVPSLQNETQGHEADIQKEKFAETKTADGREEAAADEKNVPTCSAVCSLSPRTRSQKEVSIEIVGSEDKQSEGPRKTPATRSISLRKRKDAGDQKEPDSPLPIKQADAEPACSAVAPEEDDGPEASGSAVTGTESLSTQNTPESGHKPNSHTVESNENKADSNCAITAAIPAITSTQSDEASKGQETCLSEEKRLTSAEEEIKNKVSVKLKASDVESGDKDSTESKSSPKQQTNSSSAQQEKVEGVHKKGSSPVTRKTKKASKYLARVISTDQSSTSSERSESPKSHSKKTTSDVDKSKEDTSSICSESSSIESSSSTSSLSTATATSKSSSTSNSSTSSKSYTSSSLSDVHGRATRSRRSHQLVVDSDTGLEKSPNSSKAVGNAEQFTGPGSEKSEHSLSRGKVRTASDISSKDRAKLLQGRRSMRTNRFLQDEESNETSSESSETSPTTRMTRTARSKVRSEISLPVKKTSRSVECVRGSKVAVVDSSLKAEATTESKESSTSPQKQKPAENVAKDGFRVSEDPTSRPKKKSSRFAPLKDNSCSNDTMRETRARRKTISSASDLEELLGRRVSRDSEQKKQVKGNGTDPLEEMKRNSKETQAVVQEEPKTKTSGHKKAATEADAMALRRMSASVDVTQLEVEKCVVNDKDAGTSEGESSQETRQFESKTSDTDVETDSRKYIKIAFALGSPKCKVAMKSIDKDTLKLVRGPKANEAKTLETKEVEAKVVDSTGTVPNLEENKNIYADSSEVQTSKPTAALVKIVSAEGTEPINNDDEASKPAVASANIVNAEEKRPINNDDEAIKPTAASAKIISAEGNRTINNDLRSSKPTVASADIFKSEEKGPINNDVPTSKPSTKELNPKVNKAQPTEDSKSGKREERPGQKTQNADSVSEMDAMIKLDEIPTVSEEKIETSGSATEEEKQLYRQNPAVFSAEDDQNNEDKESIPSSGADNQESTNDSLKQNALTISTENLQICEGKEMHASDPPTSTLDSCPVSTLQAGDASIPATNLDNSLTKLPDNVEDSILANSTLDDDSVREEKSERTQTPHNIDDWQNKTQHLPRNNKKTAQQEPPKSTDNNEQSKKKKPLDEVSIEQGTAESNDSLKSEVTKPDTKPAPCRQLDTCFIDSVEKSLVKSTSAKKLPKKKEKPQATAATPKDKDDTKKCKKNQLDDQKTVDSTASPKSKKKQKDLVKADKKAETETPAKRKSVAKARSVDAPKPHEGSDSKLEVPENKATDVPQPVDTENIVPEDEVQQPKEVATSAPKPMKSKGETKFYPDEHLQEEKLNATSDACSPDGVPKEKSPDLVPDPLKDIEKFIEDGVNLLKRGYKQDETEEGAGTNDGGKPDDSTTPKKCKLDENSEDKKQSHPEDDNSNSNSEHSLLTSTPSSDVETPNGIRRSHRIKNNSKSAKCLVGRGLVRDRERFSTKDDEKTVYSIDDQKMDLAEVEAKNSKFLKDMEERLSNFRVIRENEYKCERVISKEARRMLCDCFLTAEEEERGELGCGEDCLNRLLMIECGSDCTVKERCTNRRFTKFLYSPCRVFRTEKKGFGIMADIEILPGEFIMEYVGEVIDGDEFERRRNVYSQDKNKHYYFMALRSDAIIDATAKGNVSRFINHSCDPNAETQKWTVNGELRIGFFSRKSIMPGEEITFDYQYQRYGKEAQKCYCESSNCRGWIGEEPSSDEEEEEEEIDEEEGETESEEEEEHETVPIPAIPVISPPVTAEGEQMVSEVAVVGKAEETAESVPVLTPVTVEEAKPPKETQVKKKKEKRRQLDRKEEKIKRRETKQFLEDPDIEDEVRFLVKCGLRNQADTLRLSRLIVRAKLLGTRLNLLQILRAGELACRRLFLDYHGLRLLHGWMSEVIDTRDTEKSMEIRMALLSVLECLPISNKTMLTDSKVYQTVRDWSNNKESHSPSDESPKDSSTPFVPTSLPVTPEDSPTELQKLAAKLVSTWDNLPEVFRIPKRERIEQMKEHEREADRQYKGLAEDVSGSEDRRNRDRFIRNGPNSSRFKWSRSDKDKEREQRIGDRRRYIVNNGPGKDGADKTQNLADSHLSKEQRRELFAAKVARDEAEKRLAEERREFDIKCRFFGLDPKRLRPENMPFCVNPSTGQWYSTDKKPISTPPSYAHVQVPVKPKSTNPADYQIPLMDLPPLWKFAISPKGKVYYYHVKIRIPQWEPPIKILPLAGKKNIHVKASESDSSNAECVDSSDDDIDIIKGLDPVKLQAYIEKKIEDRRLQRYTRLVEEKPISPRKEEDRIYNQMEVRKYKENKEKIRKRKEEIRRRRDTLAKLTTSIESNQQESTAESDEVAVDAIPIQDYLLSSDEEDKIKEECNNSPLIDKIVQGDKIVDELDALQSKRPLKRALPIREKYEHKKRKVDKNKESTKSTKRSKDGEGSSSSKYRKIREKFRCEIAGIIVHHLRPYRKETCLSGRILTDDDFNHLARKLTHFVMVKELKYCESIGQTLVVTESVKNKSREFIKKYMAKYGGVYVRPQNDPEFKEIPFL